METISDATQIVPVVFTENPSYCHGYLRDLLRTRRRQAPAGGRGEVSYWAGKSNSRLHV